MKNNENQQSSDALPFVESADKNFFQKYPKVTKAIASTALSAGLAAGAAETVHLLQEGPSRSTQESQAKAPETGSGYVVSMPASPEDTNPGNDPNIDKRMLYWQANFDGDYKIAPTDIPPSIWSNGSQYAVTIKPGGSIVTDALNAYENMHHLSGDDQVPASVKDSINITARSYVDRLRAEGGDGVIQPGTVLTLNELTDANNNERAIISNSVVDETNK